MPYYRVVGEIPAKRHVRFRSPDGGLYAEELMGEEGFSSDSSLLYHVHPPTAIVKSEALADAAMATAMAPNYPLLPRHYRTQDLPGRADLVPSDLILGRQPLMVNDDVRISFVTADAPSELYRNSTGDETIYIYNGSIRLESVYGAIDATAGDYVVVPRGTIHRWIPAGRSASGAEPAAALVIEARGHIRPPQRYLSSTGQFLEHAPYSERDLRGVAGPLLAEGEDVPVIVRNRGGLTRLTYAYHPFDVVGWDGCLYPYAFNIADFEPIVKRTHAPPPVHQTFEGPNFVICSFCPRPLDFDPEAGPAVVRASRRRPAVLGVRDADKSEHAVGDVLHRRWQRLGVSRHGESGGYRDRDGGNQPASPAALPASAGSGQQPTHRRLHLSGQVFEAVGHRAGATPFPGARCVDRPVPSDTEQPAPESLFAADELRSEERRVGKE